MLFSLGFVVLFTIGGLTGLFLGDAGHRHPPARHVLRGGPLPLRDGRRDGAGLLRGAALLVAEDDRPDVLRLVEPAWRRPSSSSGSS